MQHESTKTSQQQQPKEEEEKAKNDRDNNNDSQKIMSTKTKVKSQTQTQTWREFNVHGAFEDAPEDVYWYEESPDLFSNDQQEEADQILEYTVTEDTTLSIKGSDDYHNSTGVTVWLGSEVLHDYLKTYPDLVRNKRVLELGAGLGLAGLTAYHLGANQVLSTDGDTVVLNRLQWNIENNTNNNNNNKSTSMECRQLIWGQDNATNFLARQETGGRLFDVICAADCIYMPQSVPLFWQTVRALLACHGKLIYVNVAASQATPEFIFGTATDYGFTWTLEEFKGKPVYTFQLEKTN